MNTDRISKARGYLLNIYFGTTSCFKADNNWANDNRRYLRCMGATNIRVSRKNKTASCVIDGETVVFKSVA